MIMGIHKCKTWFETNHISENDKCHYKKAIKKFKKCNKGLKYFEENQLKY